jgi:hypothetical protein
VYSREINDQEYTFGVSGKLIMNVLVMYDRQNDSLWSQLLGEAVEGPLKGAKLEFLPAVHTTWEDWKTQHPDTLALVKGYSGNYSSYRSYNQSGRAGVLGETFQDDRLYVKEFVVGVHLGDQAVAYPFSVLNDEPVVNDQVDDTPLLVFFNTETGAAVVFSRRLADNRVLSFSVKDALTLEDAESGSTWDGMSGLAVDGPLGGTQLKPVKHTNSFWFGWKDWFPDTELYGIE